MIEELESVLAIPREEVILAQRQGGHRDRRDPRGDRRPDPAAEGRPGRAAPGPDLRLALRPVQGRRRLRPAGRGHAPRPRHDPADGLGRRVRAPRARACSGRSSSRSSELRAGEVGYVATGLKSVRDAQVGDTVTNAAAPAATPLPGYQEAKSLVFAGIYPLSGEDYPLLRDALEKLHLNDASFTYQPESSIALGFGFRCGFLGLLHMEIVQERLEREFDLDLIAQRAIGRVPGAPDQRPRDGPASTTRPGCRTRATSRRSRSRGSASRSSPRAATSGRSWTSSTTHRGTFVGMEYLDPQRVLMTLRDAARRAHRRLLRPAQEPQPGLRLDGLRGGRLPARPTWSSSTSWSPASRSTRSA